MTHTSPSILTDAREKVGILIGQYHEDLTIIALLDQLKTRRMAEAANLSKELNLNLREILRNQESYTIFAEIDKEEQKLKAKQREVWDSMFYPNPVIWLMYKHLAYLGTGTAIVDLKGIKNHCAKPGYICTKRFHYLNAFLKSHALGDLEDVAVFPDNLGMEELYESDRITELVANLEFITDWERHEFYREGSRVAKWEDYIV